MKTQILTNNPVKGTSDWFPEEYAIRKYIFDNWRKVNKLFGYEEYLTPLVEMADLYRAKSGEDIGGKELTIIKDRGGRELAIRPEMTPSVSRMVTRRYNQLSKPIRLFSIANFFRNEKPQRGRNREFWQLNTDIFGSNSINADIEILQIALELMLIFNPPAGSFELKLNDRKLIDAVIKLCNIDLSNRFEILRILDKYEKLEKSEFEQLLRENSLNEDQIEKLTLFVNAGSIEDLLTRIPGLSPAAVDIQELMQRLKVLGYEKWVTCTPGVIRGFDYYDGIIFEVFDKSSTNNRSMFGGGRYNGLARLFGNTDIPAVGFAPGDEPMRLFLESWGKLPNVAISAPIFFPRLAGTPSEYIEILSSKLRRNNLFIEVGLEEVSIKNALSYASKKDFKNIILVGENELKNNTVSVKNLKTGDQKELSVEDATLLLLEVGYK